MSLMRFQLQSTHQREERDHPVIRSKMFPQTPAVYFTAKLSSFLRVEEIFKHCHLIYVKVEESKRQSLFSLGKAVSISQLVNIYAVSLILRTYSQLFGDVTYSTVLIQVMYYFKVYIENET